MNESPHNLEQQLREATARPLSHSSAPELLAERNTFLRLGKLLEQESRKLDTSALLNSISQPQVARSATDESFSWLGMFSLACGLLLMASAAAYFASEPGRSSFQIVQRSTPASSPRPQAYASASPWEDDWEARLQNAEAVISAVRFSRLSSADYAAAWLAASLREVESEMMAESM